MKVISLLQPWATLVVIGAKKIETRSWNTNYRGPLLIHASQKWSGEQNRIACSPPFYAHLLAAGFIGGRSAHKCGLPLGAIIGQVDVANTVCFTGNDKGWGTAWGLGVEWPLTEQEKIFGDYSPGRYGWLLSDPVQFDEPIPAKGQRMLWEYEGEIPAL